MVARLVLLALLLVFGAARAAAEPDFAITDVTVVDVVAGRELPHRTVMVRNGEIAVVVPSRRLPAGFRRLDGRGRWLIPGLWDMHMHALTDDRYRYFFPLLIANGVTDVREMGSNLPPEKVIAIRDQVERGTLLGPHLDRLTFRLLDGPGSQFRTSVELDSPEQARDAVRTFNRQGADFAKTYNLLPRPIYLAIAEEARRLGQPVEGHIPFTVSAIEAAAHQRTFEHDFGVLITLSRDEEMLRQALLSRKDSWGRTEAKAAGNIDPVKQRRLIAAMHRHHVWSVPTLNFYRAPILIADSRAVIGLPRYRYVPDWQVREWAQAMDRQMRKRLTVPELKVRHFDARRRLVHDFNRAGIPILAGTDSGATMAVAGFSLHDELEELVGAGLTPLAALRSATILPARFAHRDRVAGSIAPGKRADLVLLDADPLASISNTRRIRAVVRAGRLIDRAALDGLLEQARAAALSAPKPAHLSDD